MLLVWRKSAHLLDNCSGGFFTNTVICRPAAAPLRWGLLSCPGWSAGCWFSLTPGADSQKWKCEIESGTWNILCVPLLVHLSSVTSRSYWWVWLEYSGKSPVFDSASQSCGIHTAGCSLHRWIGDPFPDQRTKLRRAEELCGVQLLLHIEGCTLGLTRNKSLE